MTDHRGGFAEFLNGRTTRDLAKRTARSLAGLVLVSLFVLALAAWKGVDLAFMMIAVLLLVFLATLAEIMRRSTFKAASGADALADRVRDIGLDLSVLEAGQVRLWSRTLVVRPLQNEVTEALRRQLEVIVNSAFAWASKHLPLPPIAETIRGNIFLPDTLTDGAGDAVVLRIYPGLHVHMNDREEIGLTFRTNEGLTGLVFCKRRAGAAICVGVEWRRMLMDPPNFEGEGHFALTEEQKARIHIDLRAILSMPLTVPYGEKDETVGVLNIDFLHTELSEEQLGSLHRSIQSEVATLASMLRGQPMERVSVAVQKIRAS